MAWRVTRSSEHILGVSVADIRTYAKQLGSDHQLALALWKTGVYEARMLAVFVAEPERVTPALMDRWARDFDNWAICDSACFHLFDRTPHAFREGRGVERCPRGVRVAGGFRAASQRGRP
jgi:3-methyladenine DNA glycosylase AlkD